MTVHPFPRRPAEPAPTPPPQPQDCAKQAARADNLMLVIALVCVGLVAFSAALGWGP